MPDITPQDKGEYDYEGDMAKSQLRSILANAKRLHDMLKPDSNLPEWVQSKITLAEDYILTAANYMEGEMNEEVEQIEEGFNKSSPAHMKARDLVSRSSMKAVYHSDGSATIHTTGDENVSSATKVDHIHRDAGLDHNKPASAYKNSSKSKGGLTFKTKETDSSHQVHISYKGMKEEVEQVEESVATAQKVMDRANVVAKTNPDPKKRFAASGLARKAMLRTINPTGVNTGITRGGGNKTYRMLGKVPPYQLTKKTGVSEEEMKPYVKAAQAKFDAQTRAQQKGKKQAGTLSAKKEREETKQATFAQKAVDLAKGKKNRINKDPKVEVDVKIP